MLFQVCLSDCPIYKAAQSSLDLINERYNFNISLLPPQLVFAMILEQLHGFVTFHSQVFNMWREGEFAIKNDS